MPHRLPSPTREQGDGREAGDDVDNTPGKKQLVILQDEPFNMIITASAASRTAPLSSKSASCPKMIHLPQTNITLEKLPPLELSSVEMPHGSPKTTLYKVLNSISGRVSVPIE